MAYPSWLSNNDFKLLAIELGIDVIDLTRLNFDVKVEYNDEDEINGYIFRLIPDNPQEVIDQLNDLEGNIINLPATLFPEENTDWYEYQYDPVQEGDEYLQIFNNELSNLQKLNHIKLDSNQLSVILKRQIYIGIISSMETYLSDTFIATTTSDTFYLKNFVNAFPEFGKRKFELKDIFDLHGDIENLTKNIMLDVIYHDLVKVREMYRSTFLIDFPNIKDAIKCVQTRHDLVHRNGRTKDGQNIVLNDDVIESTIETINKFINSLALNLTTKQSPPWVPKAGDLPF